MGVENSQKMACLARLNLRAHCGKVNIICKQLGPSSPIGERRNIAPGHVNVNKNHIPVWSEDIWRPLGNVHHSQPNKDFMDTVDGGISPIRDYAYQQRKASHTNKMTSSPPEQTSLEPSNGAKQEIQKLERKLEKLTFEKNTLEKEKHQLQLQVDDMGLKNRNFQNREHSSDEALRGKVKALQGEIERLRGQSQSVSEEKAALELELSGLKKRMTSSPPESISLEASREIQKLEEKLEKLTAEKKTLEKEKHQLQQKVDDMGRKIMNFQNREQLPNEALQSCGKALADTGILKGCIKAVLEEKSGLELELSRLQKRLKEEQNKIQDMDKESRRKEKTIQDLTKRLSDEMGTKVAADESSLENVSIRDRPMNIASEYELLCSNQWLTAKNELDKLLPGVEEDQKMKFLCGILVTGLAEGEKLKKTMLGDIGRVLQKPGVHTHGDTDKTKALGLPEKLLQNLLDLERQTVEGTDLSVLCENIEKEVKTKASHTFDKPVMNSDGVRTYLQAAAVITWKMMLQRPLMSFRQDGLGDKWQGEKKQDVFWSSADPSTPGSTVKYYVHPALYHGEAMMVKGRVFLSKEN